MSELKAKDYYNEMKEIVDVPNFLKLTSTGINTDYESIFDFAEDYFKERMKANDANTSDEKCTLHNVSESYIWVVTDYENDIIKAFFDNEIAMKYFADNKCVKKGMQLNKMLVDE